MITRIRLQPIPSQKILSVVNGQNLYFHVYQRRDRMYMTLLADDAEVFSGMICRDRLPLKQSRTQTGLVGNVLFVDTEGTEDPRYDGLGTRWQLLTYSDDEILPESYQTPIIARETL